MILTSIVYIRKLTPRRVIYLAIPVIIVLFGEAILLYWTVLLHREEGIPIMRMAGISDILETVHPLATAEVECIQGSECIEQDETGKGSTVKTDEIVFESAVLNSKKGGAPVRGTELMFRELPDGSSWFDSHSAPSPSQSERLELGNLTGVGAVRLKSDPRQPASPADGRISRYRSLHPQKLRSPTPDQ